MALDNIALWNGPASWQYFPRLKNYFASGDQTHNVNNFDSVPSKRTKFVLVQFFKTYM